MKGRHADEDISFDFQSGRVLCIVSESGSGKSVTADTIMGLLPRSVRVSAGTIQPPLPNWGNVRDGAQRYPGTAPRLAIVPGAVITSAVSRFDVVGDGLREALDVRSTDLRRRDEALFRMSERRRRSFFPTRHASSRRCR